MVASSHLESANCPEIVGWNDMLSFVVKRVDIWLLDV
jgi:hypothetical protein